MTENQKLFIKDVKDAGYELEVSTNPAFPECPCVKNIRTLSELAGVTGANFFAEKTGTDIPGTNFSIHDAIFAISNRLPFSKIRVEEEEIIKLIIYMY